MQSPNFAVGRTALFFEEGVVDVTTPVMVTKYVAHDTYVVSVFGKPEVFYETLGWNFTLDKDKDQPEHRELVHKVYLDAYEEARGV